jgi:hypothetical protein
MHGRGEEYMQVLVGNKKERKKERDCQEAIDLGWIIILKWILDKLDGVIWTFFRLIIRTSGRLLYIRH